MSLEGNLIALAQGIGADVKALRAAQGNLASLPTTAKNNLVAALAEVHALVLASGNGVGIDDSAGTGDTDSTWSANRIVQAISDLSNELRAGVGPELDTFKEIADAMAADDTAAAALATAITKRVRFDEAQVLTAGEQGQARANIGAASETDLTALETAIGDTTVDLVGAYNTAKA